MQKFNFCGGPKKWHKFGGTLQKEKINFLKRKIYGEYCAGATQITGRPQCFLLLYL